MPGCWSTCRISPKSGADGIGLFRTELQFMIASTHAARRSSRNGALRGGARRGRRAGRSPSARSISAATRCCPISGLAQEENPAIGWRAIRLGLDRPGLLRTQIRALLQAAGGRELRVMLPMVTELGEIVQARAIDRPRGRASSRATATTCRRS